MDSEIVFLGSYFLIIKVLAEIDSFIKLLITRDLNKLLAACFPSVSPQSGSLKFRTLIIGLKNYCNFVFNT